MSMLMSYQYQQHNLTLAMDTKKVSFGFTKITKKSNILIKKPPDVANNKIELIKCLEGKEIKLIDEKLHSPPKLLVIPLIGSSKTSAALASLQNRKSILEGTAVSSNGNQSDLKNEENANKPIDAETIEKQAAREILNEITESSNLDNDNTTLTLPIKSADEIPLEGAIESTIDDYQNVPIQDFGMAMLRGMGWKEEVSKKKPEDIDDGPVLRPKGMGLGADKAIKRHVPIIPADKNEVLEIKKKAFVRIIGGKNKDLYGQIEGFDDYSTRIIVRFALGGQTDAIHEFMVQPVSKKEYQQYSKVINSAKYDKYKKSETEIQTITESRVQLDLNNLKVKIESEIKMETDNIKTEFQKVDNKHDIFINKIKQESSFDTKHETEQQCRQSRSRDHKMHNTHHYRHSSSTSESNKSKDCSPLRRHHKSKKKSSKSKKHKKNKCHSSSENEKRHKKKTKTKRRSRSRSKDRKK